MPSIRLICPECDANFQLAREMPAGKQVRCPDCDALFLPHRDDVVSPSSRRPERGENDHGPPKRSKGRGKRPGKKSNAAVVLIPVIAVAVLLLGGGAVAAVFLWLERSKPAQASGPVAMKQGFEATPVSPTGPVGLEIGNVAMEIEGEDIDGNHFKLSDYRGKVVVLDFWGHW